jgi:pimeloyl-ACP methyl ester carboxylesterase
MPSWSEDYIEANGIRLHYTRTGGAKPPVVLAHGFSDDGLCWTPVAQALEADYDVIMVDARGHGQSDAPEQGYGTAELAADLHGVIVGLGLRRPAVLGHSMGGATTFVLAGTYPDVPGAILIEDAGALNMGRARTPADEQRQARMRAWVTGLKRKTREEVIAEQRAQTPGWSDAELGPWADSKLRLSLNVLNRTDAAPVDWPAILPRITCPALLITADPERGAMVTEEGAAELRALVPQLRVAHIPNAGHNIRRDQFDRYMEVVHGFLSERMKAEG